MTLKTFSNFLKENISFTDINPKYYIDTIESKNECCIGIYYGKDREKNTKSSFYEKTNDDYITLLFHYGNNIDTLETYCQSLKKQLSQIRNVEIDDIVINFIQVLDEPIHLGRNNNTNICECIIQTHIYSNKIKKIL